MDPKEINKTGFCNKQIDNIISNDMKEYIKRYKTKNRCR